MQRKVAQDRPSKFARYRAAQRERGMKLVRLWLPDTSDPAFRAEAARQAALLRGAPEELEALDFIERATADLGLPPYRWDES